MNKKWNQVNNLVDPQSCFYGNSMGHTKQMIRIELFELYNFL